jgi:glycosyltransferase involved in cell wall biosynthesis
VKIVLAIHHFPPNYSAGAEIYTFRLAHWLIQHGHDVEVVCVESIIHSSEHDLEAVHEAYQGISVWRLHFNLVGAPDPFRQGFENPAIGAWFAEFLRETRPDVVHVNSCYLLSVSIIAAAKQQALPLIVTLHDFWFVCPRITLLKPSGALCRVPKNVAECTWCLATEKRRFRWTEIASHGVAGALAQRLLIFPPAAKLLGIRPDATVIADRRELLLTALNQADIILSPSQFLRDIYVEQGIAPSKVLYSRYGLDTSHWITPADLDQGLPGEVRISYIGQVAPHKGVHLLVTAFNRLKFATRQAKLRVYGDLTIFPDYVKKLRNIADGNGAIEFAGRFDNRRVAEILKQSDVTVAPSIWYENSPIAIMEALTTGTPVVTANLGGMPELIQHNVNGLLFEPGNADSLTTQLQRLLDEPGLIAALAASARPVRMIDDEMAQIVSLYEGVRH